MMTLAQLNDQQLRERTSLDKKQTQERIALKAKQDSERLRIGASSFNDSRYSQEYASLLQNHALENKLITERHEVEYKNFEVIRSINKKIEVDNIIEQREIRQHQIREESENSKKNWEADQKQQRSNIIERMKELLSKNKGREPEQ